MDVSCMGLLLGPSTLHYGGQKFAGPKSTKWNLMTFFLKKKEPWNLMTDDGTFRTSRPT